MSSPLIVNMDTVPTESHAHGERFAAETASLGQMIGLKQMGAMLHVVPAGKTAFPFHTHYVFEELFVVLAGEGQYRLGEAIHPIRAGDAIAAPAGGEAHQIINTGSDELRYLGVSTEGPVDVVEYPDSGKFAVSAGVTAADIKAATFKYRGRRAPADYWDGEK